MARRGRPAGTPNRHPTVYALYNGDEFVDVGTMAELIARTGLGEDSLRSYQSPSYQKRTGGTKMALIRLEGDDPQRQGGR